MQFEPVFLPCALLRLLCSRVKKEARNRSERKRKMAYTRRSEEVNKVVVLISVIVMEGRPRLC